MLGVDSRLVDVILALDGGWVKISIIVKDGSINFESFATQLENAMKQINGLNVLLGFARDYSICDF